MLSTLRRARIDAGALVFALLFLAHASAYLYFFVDDEAITLVFARNLLAGHGLSYNPAEGPIEGYSNFLHVLTMSAMLGLTWLLGLSREWVVVLGKLLSLGCGTAIVILTWRTMGRLRVPTEGRVAAALLLALAGPLAVWSNSSLETVPFALLFVLLVSSTVGDVERPALTALAATAVVLMRIDGALYVGVWLATRYLAGGPEVRKVLRTRVLPAFLAVVAVYVLWRTWYFGSLLPLPLQSKVFHKLIRHDGVVVSRAPVGYLQSLGALAGVPLLVSAAVAALPAVAWRNGRRRAALTLGASLAALLTYVGTVGDWMFGFRFVVPLLAPAVMLIGLGIGWTATLRVAGARAGVATLAVLAASGAVSFQRHFVERERKPLFWSAPSLQRERLFGQYYELYSALEPLVKPGTRIAFHEAGFIPFMLDVENIDTLGLCSSFVGALPTDDAVFTDVGRHYPLTPRPPFHAVHAYLVLREPELLVTRKSWVRSANGGQVPGALLDGHFVRLRETRWFVLYKRADRPPDPRRLQATGFLENLAHPANLSALILNGTPLPPAQRKKISRLSGRAVLISIRVASEWRALLDIEGEHPVYELYIEAGAPSRPLRLAVVLRSKSGAVVRSVERDLPANAPVLVWETWPGGATSGSVEISLTPLQGEPVDLTLAAIRVMGQRPKLRDYLRQYGIPDQRVGVERPGALPPVD